MVRIDDRGRHLRREVGRHLGRLDGADGRQFPGPLASPTKAIATRHDAELASMPASTGNLLTPEVPPSAQARRKPRTIALNTVSSPSAIVSPSATSSSAETLIAVPVVGPS